MKKLLLASTALIASAGVAAADVSLSGNARMGFIYDGNDVQMTSRARVTFTMSGETDGGLAFGASFDADDAVGAAGNTRMTQGTVFISGEFGKLTFGDVASAARAAAGDLYGVGLTGLGDLHEVAYLDRLGLAGLATGLNYDTAALYEYSIEGFTGYIGLSQNNVVRGFSINPLGVVVVDATGTLKDNVISLGAKYTWEGLTGAIGYEYSRAASSSAIVANNITSTSSHVVASLEYEMDMFKAKAFVGRVGGDLGTALTTPFTSRTHYGLSAEGSFDATTVTAFAYRGVDENIDAGVGVSYDLGGGASIKAGIVRDTFDVGVTTDSTTVADLGLAFTF
ncbi:porin [Roseibaca sp. Y0-43]|uniref:porin n=1 Tax=Roseibaca sp. Y0-43 TaxID=2816854 RepID=UPI001D0C0995|nr:porin [Roseibaca sp. Y0-43]MCC1480914.1 porin [Roseibaca sp. Y0-43]